MQCVRCGAKWQLGALNHQVSLCPLCTCNYKVFPLFRKFDSIPELLETLYIEQGSGIFLNEKYINAILNDYFPDQEEMRLYISELFAEGLGKKLSKWLEFTPSPKEIERFSAKYGKEMQNELNNFLLSFCRVQQIPGSNIGSADYYIDLVPLVKGSDYQILALEKSLSVSENEKALIMLADIYADSNSCKAAGFYEKAAASYDSVKSCLWLADYYQKRETRNYAKAIRFLKQAESQNDDKVLYQIGRLYMLGRGVAKDRVKACEYFKRAVNYGNNVKAAYQLYSCMINSDVKNKKEEAMRYLEISADGGNINARHEYAIHLLSGENIQENVEEALRILNDLASSGFMLAREQLHYMYITGYKVKKDKAMADRWKSDI